jgi:lysozyme
MGARLAWAVAAGLWLAAGCAEVPEPTPAPVAPAPPAALGRVAPPFDGLATNDAVLQMIKDSEGLRLEAYRGPSGAWLIGYGHGGDDVTPGRRITAAEADALLRDDLRAVENEIKRVVTVPINADELSAMVDLAYNIGTGAFRDSTVLRELNADNRAAAADAFLLWDKITLNGQLVADPVLGERRKTERAIFLGEAVPAAPAAGT